MIPDCGSNLQPRYGPDQKSNHILVYEMMFNQLSHSGRTHYFKPL